VKEIYWVNAASGAKRNVERETARRGMPGQDKENETE